MHRAAGSAVVAGAPRQGSRSQTLDGLPVQAVEPEGPFLPHSDQAALFQDARVVRQGRPGEAQAAGELATAHLVPLGQKADNGQPCRFSQSSVDPYEIPLLIRHDNPTFGISTTLELILPPR